MFKGRAGLDDVILHTPADRMDIVPSDIRLSGVERSLAAEVGAETVLKNAIDKAEIAPCLDDASFDLYDYLLIDCPPSMGLLTVNALTAAREIIIPVQAQVLALNGIANLRRVITVIQERLNPKLQVAGVLLTMTRPRTKLSREVEDSARRHFGDLVFRTTIRENVRVAECPSHFLPLLGYAPSSCATLDYNSFAAELLSQEGRSSNRGAADQNPSAPSLQETA
jgi:chromosome partitioning protein